MKGITDPQEEQVPLIADRAEEPERRASRAAPPRPDAAGFAVLYFYEANFDAVLGFVTRRTPCPHVAADLTADIFVAALQACERSSTSPPSTASPHPHPNPPPAHPVHGCGGQLDELGVRARVLEGDDRCATGALPEAPGAHLRYPMTFSDGEGLGIVHLDPALIHEDETLLIVVGTREGTTIRSVSSRLVTQVPACSVPNIGGGPPAHA